MLGRLALGVLVALTVPHEFCLASLPASPCIMHLLSIVQQQCHIYELLVKVYCTDTIR